MGSMVHSSHPYSRFTSEQLILRDELAIDRTILANERTVLAYLRTALTLVIVGVTLIKLVPNDAFAVGIGYVCLPIGILCGVFGTYRFFRMRAMVSACRAQSAKSL
ncbi:hypothetical protein A3D88_00885 [Candidatus Peribacteria bacterium RIFCSPHIGHO2_02_FULL_52_16]|nr:MAG: hypothetical protein A2706_05530 [Candidatus Peribacteria bacterium RIFCSPHIGHO2_01_FULL_51_35]OGJ61222.1 MAG: hypothetical protein A3D88_00885 [Candidatus Peribacteria bacterium RIFCSPHIGHO2_02_FULL_52_16]